MSLRGYLCTPYVCVVNICVIKSHLCTSYVCVVKGSPVHHTSVSLKVCLCTPYVKGSPVSVSLRVYLCTPYVCVVKGSPVHHTCTYVSLRGHLYTIHLCR